MSRLTKSTPQKPSADFPKIPNFSYILGDQSNRLDHILTDTLSSAEETRASCPMRLSDLKNSHISGLSYNRSTMVTIPEDTRIRSHDTLGDTTSDDIEAWTLDQAWSSDGSSTIARKLYGRQVPNEKKHAPAYKQSAKPRRHANRNICKVVKLISACILIMAVVALVILLVFQSKLSIEQQRANSLIMKQSNRLRVELKRLLTERDTYVNLDSEILRLEHNLGMSN